jgi:hypothetical protein
LIRLLLWPLVALTVIGLAYMTGRFAGNIRALPTIAATLAGDESGFNSEIDQKIRELFPIGSDETKLIDYLASEGFAPEWHRAREPKSALFVREGLFCQKSVRIFWRADANDALTDVGGSYASHCF